MSGGCSAIGSRMAKSVANAAVRAVNALLRYCWNSIGVQSTQGRDGRQQPDVAALVRFPVEECEPCGHAGPTVRRALYGMRNRTVVPWPTVLSRLTLPLCPSTKCFTMARPRPVPPAALARPASTR